MPILFEIIFCFFFPTCQVRVVRFYQSCSPHHPPPPPSLPSPPSPPPPPPPLSPLPVSPRPCLHPIPRPLPPLPCPLPPCQLFANLLANFCAQWALLDLNRQVPSAAGTAGPQPGTFRSSVGTAGPQPGTFRTQWAPLDLNLRPSEVSGHC